MQLKTGKVFMHGWMGKILHVDLSKSEITQFATQPYAEKYLGGRGIGARIYWEKVKPETRAFDPENCLIFMTGPLVATGAQGATQLSVVGKSPMTLPEGYCYGSFGGYVGAELKKAGFDGIVVTGRAPRPVYLWVHDGEAELQDASALWGQNGYRAGEMLQQAHGEKTRFITTGVAGERLVRTAVALASHGCTLTAGFGAVMGSKNLKAIAIQGSGKVSVADPERLKGLNRDTINISRGLNPSIHPFRALDFHTHGYSLERIGKGNCYQCGMECIRGLYRYDRRLEGLRKCQSLDYYLPWKYLREGEPVETLFDAPALADDYSIDTWELMAIVNWLYACYQSGELTEQETGLPLSMIGTREFLVKLIHSVAYREGFGDVLAEGLVRIDRVSAKARALFPYNLAPIMANDFNPPRVYFVNALLYPMEPRVHHNYLHETVFVYAAWLQNKARPGSTMVTTKVVHDIARAFWGSEAAGDFSSYEGKALAARMTQNRTCLKESLGLCDFAYPITYSLNTPDHVGDPELGAKLFNAVTGIAGEELEQYAERIYNLQRLILLREGRKVPEADFPPEYNFTEPLLAGSEFGVEMVPGPGDEPVRVIGNVLDRNKFTAMLKEYYRLRGWDEDTGIPRAGTLAALGMDDLKALTG
jgi:aldehyde:ferredoxin oxidoreductase